MALLEQEQIPPVGDGDVAGVVARAHQICGELNGGTPVDTLVNDEMNRGYADNPRLHLYPDRVRRTAVRFITASVDVYCPSHQGELPPYESAISAQTTTRQAEAHNYGRTGPSPFVARAATPGALFRDLQETGLPPLGGPDPVTTAFLGRLSVAASAV